MTAIRPFDGYIVKRSCLEHVVSPPYDALTPGERHRFGLEHPLNYINAMRSADEYPGPEQPTLEQILTINAAHLHKLRPDFEQLERPSMFVYRLTTEDHEQTAVVCEVPIDDYNNGRVVIHENTRSDKEDLLTEYMDVVGASSSPVCLAYKGNNRINGLVESIVATPPLYRFSAHDDVEQTLWQISDDRTIDDIKHGFAGVEKTYLTDGHHRFAAGSRFARRRRERNPGYSGEESFNHVLVALFPAQQLRILPYNRCVKDLNGLSVEDFLDRLAATFDVVRVDRGHALPERPAQFGMFTDNQWFRLSLKERRGPEENPVESLDVSLLQNRVLDPILGIKDVRSDPRLGYITGDTGVVGLEQCCGDDDWAVSFACYPTSIAQLMQIADSGQVMPPKSTYFDPKLRSGIFLRLY